MEFWSVVVRVEGARLGRVPLWFPQVISRSYKETENIIPDQVPLPPMFGVLATAWCSTCVICLMSVSHRALTPPRKNSCCLAHCSISRTWHPPWHMAGTTD